MRSAQVSLAIVVMATFAAATDPLDMGSAGSYAVLSAAATTAAGFTECRGFFGQAPGTAVTYDANVKWLGEYNVNNAQAVQAQADLGAARADAAGRETTPFSGVLSGLTLVPGVYYSAAALGLTGVLTFDAEGDDNAVWIIISPAAMTTAAASQMILINGGCAGNIFFVLGAAANFGAASTAIGNTLAYMAVTAGAGANIGPVYSSSAAVTLSNNKVSLTQCGEMDSEEDAEEENGEPMQDQRDTDAEMIAPKPLEGEAATTSDAVMIATEDKSCGSITCLSLAAILIATAVVVFGAVMYMRFRNKSISAPADEEMEKLDLEQVQLSEQEV
jgi:hypothetical protein